MLNFKVRLSRVDVSKRLLSVSSRLEVSKELLCERGISYSPTYVSSTDLRYYLIDGFKRLGLENYKSVRTGIPHILDLDYLSYVKHLYKDSDSDFIENLDYVTDFLKADIEYKSLISLYSKMRSRASYTKALKPLSTVKGEYGKAVFNIRDIKSPYNSLIGNVDYTYRITDIYYKYFEQLTGYKPSSSKWSFFKGCTRIDECKWIRFVIEGAIKPTSDGLDAYFSKYLEHLKDKGVTAYKDLKLFIEREQESKIFVIKRSNPFEVKYMDEYVVGFTKTLSWSDSDYTLYMPYLAWDSDLGKPLPFVNNLRGIGGEFVGRPQFEGDIPYEVYYHDRSDVCMYKKLGSSLDASQFNLSVLDKELKDISESPYKPLTDENKDDILNRYTKLLNRGYRVYGETNKRIFKT